MTQEGPASYKEAIEFLKKQKPLGKMSLSKGMCRAAQDHADDTGPAGVTGHSGTDGSSMSDRISRYGKWQSGCGENVSYGCDTGISVICQLIIDDGVPSRGHRKNIFKESFKVTGIGCSTHATYKHMCCLDYANGYDEMTGDIKAQAKKHKVTHKAQPQQKKVKTTTKQGGGDRYAKSTST